MKPILRNILITILALFVGSSVNMAIILLSSSVIPPPKGVDVTTIEGLKSSIHLFEVKHFIFPFLAHAFGTLIAAILVAKLSVKNNKSLTYGVGFIFLIGGIANCYMLPTPLWFIIFDLVFAYLPMCYLASKLIKSN
jgi:hypothetical protein